MIFENIFLQARLLLSWATSNIHVLIMKKMQGNINLSLIDHKR